MTHAECEHRLPEEADVHPVGQVHDVGCAGGIVGIEPVAMGQRRVDVHLERRGDAGQEAVRVVERNTK